MAGIKFFEMSWADISRAEIITTLSNNSALKDYLINRDPRFDWQSSGAASDLTTVTYEVDFTVSRLMDTLFLKETNLKNFELQYYNGSTWVSVFTETGNTASFYSKTFATVTAQKIKLLMNGTNPVNQEKQLGEFIITKAIGQLAGYPEIEQTPDRNLQEKKMISGRSKFVFNGESRSIKLSFKNYVGSADRALFKTLYNRYEGFLVWPSAGDESQFAYADDGYAKDDLFLMAVSKPYSHTFMNNLYQSGFNAVLSLQEVA